MNPDLSALKAFSGKYEQAILLKMYKQLQLAADGIQVIPNVKGDLVLSRLAVSAGLKPYTGTFVSMDSQLTYGDRTLTVKKAQRDLEIDPEKYRTSWMGSATPGSSNAGNKAIPYAQYVWDAYMQEVAEEVVNMLYYGRGTAAFATYSGATVYHAGDLINFTATVGSTTELQYFVCLATTTAGQSPATTPAKWKWAGNIAVNKGYGAIITDVIAAEGFSNIATTGVIDASTAYAQFLSVWRLQKEQVKMKGANMYCSYNSYELLMDDYENKVSKNFEQTNNVTYLGKTDRKCVIKPVGWLSGSDGLICSPDNNLLLGTDALSDMNSINTIEQMYSLQAGLTFVIGTQIRDLDVLTINDKVAL